MCLFSDDIKTDHLLLQWRKENYDEMILRIRLHPYISISIYITAQEGDQTQEKPKEKKSDGF